MGVGADSPEFWRDVWREVSAHALVTNKQKATTSMPERRINPLSGVISPLSSYLGAEEVGRWPFMNMKKILMVAVAAFIVFYILRSPDSAADAFKAAGKVTFEGLRDLAGSLAIFVDNLFR